MSMIDSLIDELNKSADEWNGSNMFELARMCREAVDTITELRGALLVASVDYRHLKAENAKLRELVRDMMRFFEDGSYCMTCEKVAECDASEIYECDCLMSFVFKDRMRELGVDTCYLISAPQYGEGCQECSACGEVLDGYLFDGGRCPNCGAKVVDE